MNVFEQKTKEAGDQIVEIQKGILYHWDEIPSRTWLAASFHQLWKLTQPENDGFGDVVAPEFESQEVIQAREFLKVVSNYLQDLEKRDSE